MRFYAAWAFAVITPTWGRKGVRKMTNTEQYREHIERTFNAFCKIVLYHAALGAYKEIRKKQQFEVSLDYLREFDFEPIATTDEYFVKYDMPTTFAVRGETVIVESEQLAAALLRLPESGGKCCFCGTTSVTAIKKSDGCLEFAEARSSIGGKGHCVCCGKKWRC